MSRILIGSAAAAGALLAAAPSLAQQTCTRAQLQSAVDTYLAAQIAGDPSKIAGGQPVAYKEDRAETDIATGILSKKLAIQFHHSLLDTEQCETFTEMVDPNTAAPYVLGVHLTLKGGKIAEIDTLSTTTGDWLFNAKNFLTWASEEDWGPIPTADRDSRETLIAAANLYLDRFSSEDAPVPWGYPCRRLEGGAITRGDTCEAGVPQGVHFPIRHHVVDADIGAVVALVPFGGEGGLPDSHTFRVEKGKLRWVHTITVCNREGMKCPQVPDGGMPPPNSEGQGAAQSTAQGTAQGAAQN